MKIIISPAKKMKVNSDLFECSSPLFLSQAKQLSASLGEKSIEELMKLMCCNQSIATLNYDRYSNFNLSANLTPALLAYDGLQYKYMSPIVFDNTSFSYVSNHLLILSALYGALRPMDGVTPYRLEMAAKLHVDNCKNMYEYWNSQIYDSLLADENLIVDLASDEYSRAVRPYASASQQWIKLVFGQLIAGKVVEKGAYVKMARGEMVSYMASNNVTTKQGVKQFDRLGYVFNSELSSENKYVFIKGE